MNAYSVWLPVAAQLLILSLSCLGPYRAASIHPLFVFSGLPLIRKEKPIINEDSKILKRNTAWGAVNSGEAGLAMSSWSGSYSIHHPDLIHLVIRILKEHNIEYIRAPYGAGAQVYATTYIPFP